MSVGNKTTSSYVHALYPWQEIVTCDVRAGIIYIYWIAFCSNKYLHCCLISDGRSATGNFGALGGKLSTKYHGFTLHIPPGALEEDEKINLQVLTEIPNGLTLKEDELLVSHGFQCYPSGLRFKKPAKLIIPHCALVTAPNKVQTILYSWNQSGN